jgi:prevent-host-death family protein
MRWDREAENGGAEKLLFSKKNLDFSYNYGYIITNESKLEEIMEKQFSIAEAKNKLTSIIHDVEAGTPLKLTRHGKPVAILLSIREYEKLKTKKEIFWPKLVEFRKAMDKEKVEITDDDFSNLRDSSAGREIKI